MMISLKKICQRCADQFNNNGNSDTGILNLAALQTGNELNEFGEKNLDFKNSDLAAILMHKMVRTSYDAIATKCAHLTEDERTLVREAIAAEIGHTVNGKRLMKIVAEAAAAKFVSHFTLRQKNAAGKMVYVPPNLPMIPNGQESTVKCDIIDLANKELSATGIPERRVLPSTFKRFQDRLKNAKKNNEYYVVADPLVRCSIQRAKAQRELDKETAEMQKIVADKVKSSIKVQLTTLGADVDEWEAFIEEFSANVAERTVPDIQPTSAGQTVLADFVAKITKGLEGPMRKAAAAANPTLAVPTDQKLYESYKMIMEATLNGKANEETMKALAGAAKEMDFDPRASDNNAEVNRLINIGDGIQRVLAQEPSLQRHLDFAIPAEADTTVLAWYFLEHVALEAIKPFVYAIKLHFTPVSSIFDVNTIVDKFCKTEQYKINLQANDDDGPADTAVTAKIKLKNFLNSIAGTPAAADQAYAPIIYSHPEVLEQASKICKQKTKKRKAKADGKNKGKRRKDGDVEVCNKYLRGKCVQQGSCPDGNKHLHPSSTQAQDYAAAAGTPGDIKKVIKAARQKAAGREQLLVAVRNAQGCVPYVKGACRKKGCDKEHNREQRSQFRNLGFGRRRRTDGTSSHIKDAPPTQKKEAGCKWLAKGLQCRFQNNCFYSHKPAAVEAEKQRLIQAGWYYCRNGENCKKRGCSYVHRRDGSTGQSDIMARLGKPVTPARRNVPRIYLSTEDAIKKASQHAGSTDPTEKFLLSMGRSKYSNFNIPDVKNNCCYMLSLSRVADGELPPGDDADGQFIPAV